jgi:hypothetical protein
MRLGDPGAWRLITKLQQTTGDVRNMSNYLSSMLVLGGFFLAMPHAAAQAPDVLAEYPNGTFLENVTRSPNGALVFTSYFGKTIELIERGKPTRTLSTLPVHPVGIIRFGDGYLVSAHGAPFTSGPAFTQTQQILALDKMAR